jgi:autotransporter-associated beta strand protein
MKFTPIIPAILAFNAMQAMGQLPLSWDTDSVTPGAQGAVTSPAVWSASGVTWWNTAFTQNWTSGADAVFEGTPGIVQLQSTLTANDLTFQTGTFTIPASSFAGAYEIKADTNSGQRLILQLDGSQVPNVSVASGVRAIISTTHVDTGLTGGSGFVKTGAGSLILQQNASGTSPITGSVQVNQGRLVLDSMVDTTLEGTNRFPNLATLASTPIIARDGAFLQLDRSHILGGNATMGVKHIRLENGGILALANSRQYLAGLNIVRGAVILADRKTLSAGTDESDTSALLTPTGGLSVTSGAHPTITSSIATGIEVREGTLTFDIADGATLLDFQISGSISSPGGSTENVIKNGAGTIRLESANSFQGDLLVNSGLVIANAANVFGAATSGGNGEVRVASGGAVDLGGNLHTNNKNWFIAGNGPDGNGAILNLSGFDLGDYSRIVNLTLTGNASIGGSQNYQIGVPPTLLGSGSINGGGFTLTKRGNNDITVRAASTNITWVLNGGTLSAAVNNAFGSNAFTLTNGTLRGVGNVVIPNALDLSNGGTLTALTGTTTFSGVISLGAFNLFCPVPADGTVVLSNNIVGVKGGPGTVVKSGAGTLILNASASETNVQAGTLRGTGTISPGLTVANGATVSPGGTTPGTLNVAVNTSINGNWQVVVQGANASRLNTANSLFISPTATLSFAPGNSYTQPVYIIGQYNSLSGGFSSLPKMPPGYSLEMNYNGLKQIALVQNATTPYTTWITARGLSGDDAQPDEDPDGDRVSNLLEFVFGSEPNPANPNSQTLLSPAVQVASPTHFTVTFRRQAVATYVNPVVRFGTDLENPASWTTAVHGVGGVTVVVTPNHFGTGIDRVVATIPRGSNSRMFAHVRAIMP